MGQAAGYQRPVQGQVVKVLVALALAGLLATGAEARIHRDHKPVAEFQRQNPCPSTGKRRGACPGYVVDHVIALACGGQNHPSNLQWQTIAEGKAKDKWERVGCDGLPHAKKP